MEFYLDASDQIAGRLASSVAKMLLKGDKVFIVNAEKAVVSGNKKKVEEDFKVKVARGDPYHGPFYPRHPDRILKRFVRGMLPKSPRGREALKNLKVFISVPQEIEGKNLQKLKQSENKLECSYLSLGKIGKALTGTEY